MRVINKIIIGTGLAFAAGFIGQKVTAAEYGRVVSVQHNYAYVTTYIPRQQCRQAPDPGNVLLGIILGGVSGKVITKVIDSYDITYTWNGYYGESRTSIPYQRGDEVLVNVSINLN